MIAKAAWSTRQFIEDGIEEQKQSRTIYINISRIYFQLEYMQLDIYIPWYLLKHNDTEYAIQTTKTVHIYSRHSRRYTYFALSYIQIGRSHRYFGNINHQKIHDHIQKEKGRDIIRWLLQHENTRASCAYDRWGKSWLFFTHIYSKLNQGNIDIIHVNSSNMNT